MTQLPDPMFRPPPASGNGFGLAGFICSVVGFFTCGLLSPIGLILSIVGKFREPKGFAIAGLILGIVGSLWVVVAFVFGLFGLMLVAAGLGALAPFLNSMAEMEHLSRDVQGYHQAHGALPASLDQLPGEKPEDLTDQWGSPYRYVPGADGVSFTISSDGPDKTPGTADDLKPPASTR